MNPAARIVERLLPAQDRWELLRACLAADDEIAHAAWWRWRERAGDPIVALSTRPGDLRAALPIVLEGARRADEDDPALLTYLRAARVRERLRWQACASVLFEAGAALEARQLPFVVSGDFALAQAYDDPAVRHCGALDLVVAGDSLRTAADALRRSGFRRDRGRRLTHLSGLPVGVSATAIGEPYEGLDLKTLYASGRTVTVAETEARIPSNLHRLVETLARPATTAAGADFFWASDIVQLCRAGTDWPELVAESERLGLELESWVLLRALHERLALPVPASSLSALEACATRSSRRRDRLLLAAVARSQPRLAVAAARPWQVPLVLARATPGVLRKSTREVARRARSSPSRDREPTRPK